MKLFKSSFFYIALFSIMTILFIQSCQQSSSSIFKKLSPEQTGIDFTNTVQNTEAFNIFNYRNFYNGAGVAIGDINNDGLADVYLTGNLEKNKLYLNQGDFKFKDISSTSGTEGRKLWSTGVVMVDINNDGLLDIYVCNAGYEKGRIPQNELFINNGDLTFTEQAAEYGLDDDGYTTHAAFFDYDMDGDLDAYILNNSFIPVNTLELSNKRELYAEDWKVKDFLKGGGDKLLRNDNGQFVDVTRESGIYGSLIGFGLGITVGDINNDMYPDLYVSNDFYERDYLYINNGDGTFKEDIKNKMQHLSLSSMGADMADINNDGYPEIFVTEMLPSDEYRLKTTTMFENYNRYDLKLKKDFYHQYMQNTLQLNNQNQTFSEIAHFSGVSASDWSWGALMFDADNDGWRDIYVCNGIYHDLTNQDFINFFANDVMQKMALSGKKEGLNKVIDEMESNPIPNKFFKNNQNLTFEDGGKKAGLDIPSFSNGAAYGDLDNDGDLDLIVNNLNQPTFVFQNNTSETKENHFVSISLKGKGTNRFAVGAKVFVHIGEQKMMAQNIPTRGFQSSIDYKMVFGLGKQTQIDSIVVTWTNRTRTIINQPEIDKTHIIDQNEGVTLPYQSPQNIGSTIFSTVEETNFDRHIENDYVDFYQEGLIARMLSREGPAAAVADVNGDGLEDIFIGGAKHQLSSLYLQEKGGQFKLIPQPDFERRKYFEDTYAVFFDADGDGDKDLFVGSGGNEKGVGDKELQDRIYINDGQGNLKLTNGLSSNGFNTSTALPFDYDGDGDIDLFVGSRSLPQNYGVPPKSFLYENQGNGTFVDKTQDVAPMLNSLGMVTNTQWINIMGDEKKELFIIGEWMSLRIFAFKSGKLVEQKSNLNDYWGWWYTSTATDVDGDGDLDIVLGNRGENFYFTGSKKSPIKLWIRDFDDNKTIDKIMTKTINGKDMPIQLQDELTKQIVSLKKKDLKHKEFASKSIQDLFPNMRQSFVQRANYFKSVVAINEGDGKFTLQPLPDEVQFSCISDIYCTDLNGDNAIDLVLGGNYNGFKPQYSKLDGSFGHVLLNNGTGSFHSVNYKESGFFVKGDMKFILPIKVNDKQHLLTILNNKKPKLFKLNR